MKLMSCLVVLLQVSLLTLQDTTSALQIDVFEKDGLFDCYKIPYIMTTIEGTLIAMAEARGPEDAPPGTNTGTCMDWDATYLVVKRSVDNGLTWSPLKVAVPGIYGVHTVAGNAAIVQNQLTGRIFMPFNRGNIENWITYSDDDGQTWAKPVRLIDLEKSSRTWMGYGPPGGIQLLSPNSKFYGRLIVPGYFSTFPIYDNGLWTSSFVMYSDDNGTTWQETEPIANGVFGPLKGIAGNEAQIVELEDGSLLINSRTWRGNRIQSRSFDGGITWTTYERTSLPTPFIGCEGSIIAESPDFLLYSGPAGPTSSVKRTEMTVWESPDHGKTWNKLALLFDEGGASYSSLTKLLDGRIGILYEISNATETVFVPGNIIFEYVNTTRVPIPWVPAITTAFPQVASDETWQQDDGDAAIYVGSVEWYALRASNMVLAILALLAFIVADLWPCCCCCDPAVNFVKEKVCHRKQGDVEDQKAVVNNNGDSVTSLQDAEEDDRTTKEKFKQRGMVFSKYFIIWAFQALCTFNLFFWIIGVVGQYLFAYDDAARWRYQSFACMIGLIVSIVVCGIVIVARKFYD